MSDSQSLTRGPIAKGIIYFAFPLLVSNLFQQLYNAVDSVVVGHYAGSAALAAVGSTGAIINLLIGFFLGIATGTNVLYAMHYGAGDHKGLKKLIDGAMILSVLAALFISVVGIAFSDKLLDAMNTPADVKPLSKQYLNIFLGGTIVTMVYNVGSGMLRAEGDSKRPLYYLVAGGVTNLVLDLVFVAVLKWGVVGAAIATVAAQAVSAVLTLIRLTRLNPEYRLNFRTIRLDKVAITDIIRISVPCGLQGSMFNISNLLVQAKINTFDTIAMAGVTAYTKIDGFIYMPMMAVGLAASTYVGQNVGAGNFGRIKSGIRICCLLAAGSSALMGAIVLLSGRNAVALFSNDAEAQTYALQMMYFLAPFSWIYSLSEILGGSIRGAGEPGKVTVITALCICVFRVIWLTVMLKYFNDIRVVFLCYPISWILSAIAMTLFYFFGSRIRKTIRSQSPSDKKAQAV